MARKTDIETTEQHLRELPLMLQVYRPTSIETFAKQLSELGFCASTILGFARCGFIARCIKTGVYSMAGRS